MAIHVYRSTADGDVLVRRPAPFDDIVSFYSTRDDKERQFVSAGIFDSLERLDGGDEYLVAIRGFNAFETREAVHRLSGGHQQAVTGSAQHDGKNDAHERAWELIGQAVPGVVLVSGPAGTGKSWFLRKLSSRYAGRMVVLAPTGIAALNVAGQTIHRFFGLPQHPLVPAQIAQEAKVKPDVLRALELLVIDEVSMVRADVLDAIDALLRCHRRSQLPFGGVRVALFGDPFQLPPVVTAEDAPILRKLGYLGTSAYFTESQAFQRSGARVVEFSRVYRQSDQAFIGLLSRVREGAATPDDMSALNARVRPLMFAELDDAVVLASRKARAEEINARRMALLPFAEVELTGAVSGWFPEDALPVPRRLVLKQGARVMLTRNDQDGRWVNGSVGTITKVLSSPEVHVRLGSGQTVNVGPARWEQIQYSLNPHTGLIEAVTVGEFTQFPLQPAWSVTIHKSQGMTLDRAHVDLGRGAFAVGQTYVALSRCRAIEGLSLESPIGPRDIRVDLGMSAFFRAARSMSLPTRYT